jgi:hypothetical protein
VDVAAQRDKGFDVAGALESSQQATRFPVPGYIGKATPNLVDSHHNSARIVVS